MHILLGWGLSARAERYEGILSLSSVLTTTGSPRLQLVHPIFLLIRKRCPFLKALYHCLLGNCHNKH